MHYKHTCIPPFDHKRGKSWHLLKTIVFFFGIPPSGTGKVAHSNSLSIKRVYPGRGCVTRRSRRGLDHHSAIRISLEPCVAGCVPHIWIHNHTIQYMMIDVYTYTLHTYPIHIHSYSVALDVVMGGRAPPSSAPSGMLDFIWAQPLCSHQRLWGDNVNSTMPFANVPSNLTSWRRGRNANCKNWVKKLKSWLSMTSSQRWLFFECGELQVYHVTFEGIRNRRICICQHTVALIFKVLVI